MMTGTISIGKLRNTCKALATIFVFGSIIMSHGYAQKTKPAKGEREAMLVFYNVENLFDTINDPLINDDEFTPESEKNWNSERYESKLQKLAEVIAGIDDDGFPALVGLCEVENEAVLRDLVSRPELKKGKYDIAHSDSPDERGIDVALLYSSKVFTPISHYYLTVPMPEGERPTRDILHVRGTLKKGPEIHVFVNHWPSRYGGAEESEHKRIAAAEVLRRAITNILTVNPEAYIICMGDFNDYPENKSLRHILKSEIREDAPIDMVNLMDGMKETKRGSYNYRGDWDFLDQIVVSHTLADTQQVYVKPDVTGPYHKPEMLYIDEKYGDEKPNRTYGGPTYYGGYSDHLPVYTVIVYQK